VKLQGPQGFRSGAAWAAFQGIRPAIIFSAIHCRQATFISSEEWCSIPWQLHAKPPWQKAMDIMAQVPELLEKFDKLNQITSCDYWQVRRMQLLNRCGILDEALQAWYQDLPSSFDLETAGDLWYTKASRRIDSPFPIELYFRDQIHAQALILYWATCVLVYNTMQKVRQAPDSTTASQVKPALPARHEILSTQTDPYHYATCIVQSIPYFLDPSVGLLTRKIFAFPLGTAYAYFASLPKGPSTTLASNVSESSVSTVTDMSECDGGARTDLSDLIAEVGDIDVESIRTYLESMAKAMHIYGMQRDILGEPSSPENAALAKSIPK
jgi:hypothetical protein